MRKLTLLSLLLLARAAAAQELMDLLQQGPVVLVELGKSGKFEKATAIIHIKKPPAEVWAVAEDIGRYKEFMPKLIKSDATKVEENQVDMDAEIDVPGVNTTYKFRYDLDPKKLSLHGQWQSGDIKGSYCDWRIVPFKGESLLYYSNASKNFSSLAESLEDDQQTVTVGLNVSSALAVAKAVKKRVEDGAGVAKAP